MDFDVLKDFVASGAVSAETMDKYQNLIPAELLEVWQKYGLGSFYGGYLKIINPDEYRDVLDHSYYAAQESVPIFATGFGDIIIWRKNTYVELIKYRKGAAETLSSGFDFFFGDLAAESRLVRKLDKNLYNDAVSKRGALEYDECFAYAPLLPLGGSESVDNLQKVKIKPHIDLIRQMLGRIE